MYMVRWLIVGLIVGFATSKVLPRSEACGTPVDVILGALGAVGAGGLLHSYGYGMAVALPAAVAGAVVLVCVVHLISPRGSSPGKGVSRAA